MSGIAGLAALVVATVLCANSSAAAWTPPIGIPAPPFGINEGAPAVPNPWLTSTPGFYYVDKSNPAATDSGNTYGTPALPRLTIPLSLPAGSVVEVHGLYDVQHNSPNGIVINGTKEAPVFIRGTSATTKPVISRFWELSGSYYVLENLEFASSGVPSSKNQIIFHSPTSFATLRFCDVHGALDHGGIAVVSFNTQTVGGVVIYANTIHDNGNVNATSDQDVHGVSVGSRVSNLWIIDNEIYRNSGDGIQINAGQADQATTHHIYVGRNTSHHNKQSGMWTKQAVDVVFSQNVIHSHRPGNSSPGACTGFQYAPHRVWFLFNQIFDCDLGIGTGSDNGLGFGTESYFIGNIISSIHHSGSYNPGSGWSNAAISLPGGVNRYVVSNTMYDVDAGIVSPGSTGAVYMSNNVIAGVTETQGAHIFLEMASLAAGSSMHHSLLDSPARIKWGTGTVYTLSGFKTAFSAQGVGSINGDPLFVNPAVYDLRLQAGSLGIDAGVADSVYQTFYSLYGIDIAKDAAGVARPQGAAYDMGAYEFGAGGAVLPAPSNVIVK